ncbi:Lysophospholipase L1 [Chitinophaga sp. CF118]|uniref:SGNH/GDSL hydrolase family protein n=1 Tax=Chitinophaga sp. CF118 TaxID=1884367 RepID=UPI0008E0B3EF|nr:SGNH/GDSL hydrolase family protein [Chitinophaga sp. CF118]SFD89093.1 Lysophospholipase L1 [Chitinophaga sp. CF118]
MRKYLYFILSLTVSISSCSKNERSDLDVPPEPGKNTPDSATIVIIGSSTAAGVGATPSDSAWVNRLRLATIENKKVLTYVNLAVAGYTTYQGMPNGYMKNDRPATDTAKNITKALSYHPSLVMITYPTNDVANNYTDDEIMDNYKEMVHLLDSAKVNYILFGTQPRNFAETPRRERLKTLNGRIRSAYTDHCNDNFDALDTTDLNIKPTLSYGDGVHLNNTGHYIIVQSVLAHPVFQNIIKQN